MESNLVLKNVQKTAGWVWKWIGTIIETEMKNTHFKIRNQLETMNTEQTRNGAKDLKEFRK